MAYPNKEKESCRRCGASDITIIEAHHINRNRADNSPENIAFLCCNCHTLLHKAMREDDEDTISEFGICKVEETEESKQLRTEARELIVEVQRDRESHTQIIEACERFLSNSSDENRKRIHELYERSKEPFMGCEFYKGSDRGRHKIHEPEVEK